MYEAGNLMDMHVILSLFIPVTNVRIGSGRVYRATRQLGLSLLSDTWFWSVRLSLHLTRMQAASSSSRGPVQNIWSNLVMNFKIFHSL